MRKKEPKKDPHYDAISWRNFPTDKTMNAFLKEYQQKTNRKRDPSFAWIKGAVNALERDDEKKPVYDDLFSPRDIDADMSHSTTPRLIPYETQALLWAIAIVRDEDKNLKGDAFAERVFSVLANNMSQNPVADNYVDILTLSQFRIQQELLRKFEGLLRQRLELLYNHIFMNPAGIQINELKHVLEQIDYLLTDFSGNTSDLKNTSAKQDLQTLYASLLTLRKEVVIEEATKEGSVEKLNWRNKRAPLIEKLNKQLLQTSRSPKPKEVSDFLCNYNEYLMRYLDPDIKAQASAFSEAYSELNDYYFSNMHVAQFEEIVRSELEDFSQAIFDELDRMEQVGTASDYQPKSLAVGYLRLRLTQVQEDILSKMREALRMLRAAFSFLFFTKTDTVFALVNNNNLLGYDGNKIRNASNYMMSIASALLEECQYMLPPAEENLSLGEKILSAYEHVFSPGHESGINSMMLQQMMHVLATEPNVSMHYLFAIADLLRRMCKVYVRCECEKHSKLLLEEFEQMQKLLSV